MLQFLWCCSLAVVLAWWRLLVAVKIQLIEQFTLLRLAMVLSETQLPAKLVRGIDGLKYPSGLWLNTEYGRWQTAFDMNKYFDEIISIFAGC